MHTYDYTHVPLSHVGVSNKLCSNEVGKGKSGLPSMQVVGIGEVLREAIALHESRGGEVGHLERGWGERERERERERNEHIAGNLCTLT